MGKSTKIGIYTYFQEPLDKVVWSFLGAESSTLRWAVISFLAADNKGAVMRRVSIFSFLAFLFFVLVFELGRAATTSHVYDDLNCLVRPDYDIGVKVTTIIFSYDSAGNMLTHIVTADHLVGYVDNSQGINPADAVLCLQIVSGETSSGLIYGAADINGDDRISIVETIHKTT